MEEALAKRNLELSKGAEAKDDDEKGNLLEYLVKHTQGMLSLSILFFNCLISFCGNTLLDKNILKDEVN